MDGPDRGPKRGERALPVGEQGGHGCRESKSCHHPRNTSAGGRGGEPAERRRNRTGDDSDDSLGLDDAARSVASERCQFPAPMLRYMAASSSFAGRTKFGRLAGRSPGRSAESGSSL
jgi:hypothetical protein